MSTFDKLVLEFLREIRTDLRIGIVEMKRRSSWDARNHGLLESIDRSLSQGELQAEMRHFLTLFKPELASSRPVQILEKEKSEFFSEMDESLAKASGIGISGTEIPAPDSSAQKPGT